MYKLERYDEQYGQDRLANTQEFTNKQEALDNLQDQLTDDQCSGYYYTYKLYEKQDWKQIPFNIQVTA